MTFADGMDQMLVTVCAAKAMKDEAFNGDNI
jgi:hypothetical protein